MRPSLTPCFFVNSSCDLLRNSCTALMSHSLKVVRVAVVWCDITSCAAIFRRNGDMRLRATRPSADWRSSAARGGKLTASPAGFFSATASTSPFVRRPSLPVPAIFSGSRCSSSTMRRTAGESGTAAGSVDAGPRSATAATAAFFSASGAFFSSGLAFCSTAGASCESSMVATTSPIFTS